MKDKEETKAPLLKELEEVRRRVAELETAVAERQQAEEQQILSLKVIQRLNTGGDQEKIIHDILILVKEFSGCDAVGIRLQEGEDFPYYDTNGFVEGHVPVENRLCALDQKGEIIRDSQGNPVLECMCGNIICGRFDPRKPFFSEGGSFWTNSTTELLASTTDEDRLARTRNRCHEEGYESVALVPLSSEGGTIGLLQLNDMQRNHFTAGLIRFYEGIGESIGIAFTRQQAEEKIKHLNLILGTIRRVNQLIAIEKDRERLLKGICDSLIATRGYYNVWLALLDESGKLVTYAEAGLGKDFLPMVERLKRGELPVCGQRALIQADAVVTNDPLSTCAECSLAEKYAGRGGITIRLEHGGKLYGLLVASVPPRFITDEEEQALFREIAGDIAFALHDIELEEERKQAETMLRLERGNFLNSLDSSPLGIRIVTAEGELLHANQAILDIYGYNSIEELKAAPAKQRYTPESHAEYQERKERRRLGKPVPDNYEISIVRKDGEVRHLEVFRKEVLWDGKTQFQALYHDITERKQAEEELKRNKEYLETLNDSLSETILTVDIPDNIDDRTVRYVNKAVENIFGYKQKEWLGKSPVAQYASKEDFINSGKILKSAFSRGTKVIHRELLLKKKNGETFPAELTTTFLRTGGKVRQIISIIRDITERKQMEEALRESEERFRSVAETAIDAIISADSHGTIVYWNSAAETTFGFSADEVIGKSVTNIIPERLRKAHQAGFERLISTGETKIIGQIVELVGLRKDGGEFTLELTLARWKTENEQFFTAIIRDSTERKKMQAQLMTNDRLASIGELVSGVAHELNNPLTGVIGFSDLLMDRKDLPDDVKEDLKVINSEAQRTANIVKNLLTFARKHPIKKQPTDINKAIEAVLELRAYEQKVNNIEVDTRFTLNLPETMANSFDLQQVFLNIIVNAEHAMLEAHRGGIMTITTEQDGDIIRASFADDGRGISKEDLGHVFDPFFTTKEVGKGTGLGLSICHGIITEHGGRIYAESEPGKGATFIVELPVLITDHEGTTNENS